MEAYEHDGERDVYLLLFFFFSFLSYFVLILDRLAYFMTWLCALWRRILSCDSKCQNGCVNNGHKKVPIFSILAILWLSIGSHERFDEVKMNLPKHQYIPFYITYMNVDGI